MDLPDGLVENRLEIPLGKGRALEVLPRADLLGTVDTHLERYRSHAFLVQALNGIGVLAQIELGAHQDDGDTGGVMLDLGVPLPEKSACRSICVASPPPPSLQSYSPWT